MEKSIITQVAALFASQIINLTGSGLESSEPVDTIPALEILFNLKRDVLAAHLPTGNCRFLDQRAALNTLFNLQINAILDGDIALDGQTFSQQIGILWDQTEIILNPPSLAPIDPTTLEMAYRLA